MLLPEAMAPMTTTSCGIPGPSHIRFNRDPHLILAEQPWDLLAWLHEMASLGLNRAKWLHDHTPEPATARLTSR